VHVPLRGLQILVSGQLLNRPRWGALLRAVKARCGPAEAPKSDGEHFLFNAFPDAAGNQVELTLVQNWVDTLKSLVPKESR
jgi:hypothetical protein